MKLVFLNLKNLFGKNLWFGLMIIITIVTGSFAVCFSMGVLNNNKYVSMEDAITTNQLNFRFPSEISYAEHSEVFREICEIFEDGLTELTLSYTVIDDDPDKFSFTTYCTFADMEDGNYVTCWSLDYIIAYQVGIGRNLSDIDYSEGRKLAVVNDNVGEVGDYVSFGDEQYEIIGIRNVGYDSEMPIYVIPITAWGDNPVSDVSISLERIPLRNEYNKLDSLLKKNFGENYEFGIYYGENIDTKALYRTIGCAVLGIMAVVLITLLFLFGYIYERRRRSMAIFRLTGCKHKRAVRLLLTEALIITMPSCVAGVALFALLKEVFFDRYYVYMKAFFNIWVYVGIVSFITVMILLEILFLSLKLLSRPVKTEIVEVRR
ncbi:MAG: ABC transporter permease [Wujia sp.]